MNMKDIAKIAGVSASTVSKVLNHKDDDLSEETRKKVLQVVREYQYIPFAKVRQEAGGRSNLLGVIVSRQESGILELIGGIADKAEQSGYSIILCNMKGSADKVEKYIKVLLGKSVEGVILIGKGSLSVNELPVPLVSVNAEEGERKRTDISYLYYDRKEAGALAAGYLIEQGHHKIGCLLSAGESEIEAGYISALREHQIPVEHKLICTGETAEETAGAGIDSCLNFGATALICGTVPIACCAQHMLQERGIGIPNEVSLMVAEDSALAGLMGNGLSAVSIPEYKIGTQAAGQIISEIESRNRECVQKKVPLNLNKRNSVSVPPPDKRREKMIVVGSMNADVTISVPAIPAGGETVMADKVSVMPGGKGANQAVGAGKLGGLVYLVGRLGNDADGKLLYHSLLHHNVRTDGVIFDPAMPSGKAYINVAEDGESSIVVYPGANRHLDPSQITQCRQLFRGAKYCLLSMEIPEDAALYTAKLCEEEGVLVMLKPAGVQMVSGEILEKTAYLIPNEKELEQLVPGALPIEEKAQMLLDRGVEHVIVTLGKKGCYLRNKEHSRFFPGADFAPVDTTGGADSFISALAVYLSEGKDIFRAIGFATYAAGISITRQGAQPSLPDRTAVDAYQDDINLKYGELDKRK